MSHGCVSLPLYFSSLALRLGAARRGVWSARIDLYWAWIVWIRPIGDDRIRGYQRRFRWLLVAHAIQSRLADDPLNDIADAPMTAPADATHRAW